MKQRSCRGTSASCCLAAGLALLAASACPEGPAPLSLDGSSADAGPPDAGAALACDAEDLIQELWSFDDALVVFSSPRALELNGDGTKDIVIGRGGDELDPGAATAISGATGTLLWDAPADKPLVGSATVIALDDDGIGDVVIGGREAVLHALRGANGERLWSFDGGSDPAAAGWRNFYTSQRIADVDADGKEDLVVATGGEGSAGPFEARPAGYLAILSGASGAVLARLATPDAAETYMSPLLYDHPGDGQYVLVGTGGETMPGGLYRIRLEDLLNEREDGFEVLLLERERGVIAPPSLADLTGDGTLDIVVATMGGTLAALDGVDGGVLWKVQREGRETYASPGIGFLNGHDGVPDVFAQFSIGTWPEYDAAEHLAVDGVTGSIEYERQLGVFVSSGPLLADFDGDGIDEVLFGASSKTAGDGTSYAVYLFHPTTQRLESILPELGALSLAAPLLDDLDDDGCLDLVVSVSTARDGPEERASTRRYRLRAHADKPPSWGAYLGTNHDGALLE